LVALGHPDEGDDEDSCSFEAENWKTFWRLVQVGGPPWRGGAGPDPSRDR
jgi:hypothetical protein